MNTTITIRQSTPEDAPVVAQLWMMAFKDLFYYTFGDRAQQFLEEWFERDPSIFEQQVIAEMDAAPVGFLQLEWQQNGSQNTFLTMRKNLKHFVPLLRLAYKYLGPLRMLSAVARMALIDYQPYKPHEMYVKMIGVDERCRGMGVGTQLLNYADTRAKENGCTHLALEVLATNEGAIRLYERHDYARGRLERPRYFRWVSGKTCGIYRMVKAL